ncbi:MAG TPA: hypothetical protein VGI19_17445 [Candidatus Cybelea sp.]|jgi:hypothetical protein
MHTFILAAGLSLAFFADVPQQTLEPRIALARIVRTIVAAYAVGAPPTPATAPTAAPGDDPTIDGMVRRFWNQLASGEVDRSVLTPDFAAQLTPDNLAQVRASIAMLGEIRSFTFVGKTQAGKASIYRYTLEFAGGAEHEWDVTVTADDKIADSQVAQ